MEAGLKLVPVVNIYSVVSIGLKYFDLIIGKFDQQANMIIFTMSNKSLKSALRSLSFH
jgi:hypothetical protein